MKFLGDYMYNKFLGNPGALPPHIRDHNGTGKVRLHNDWPYPFNKIPRSWNAYGPRAGRRNPGYLPWPPRLVEGYDVARWENAGASSILYIPAFHDKLVIPSMVYGRIHKAVEMNPSHPAFDKQIDVYLPFWEETNVREYEENGEWKLSVSPNHYSPSALQKFCFRKGFLKLWPDYYSTYRILKKKEWPTQLTPKIGPHGEDLVLFTRRGFRPDHVDTYYNETKIITGGLHWE